MSEILASRDLEFLHPAARVIGGPAVRNMATVGGNLFARPPLWRSRHGPSGTRCRGSSCRIIGRAAAAARPISCATATVSRARWLPRVSRRRGRARGLFASGRFRASSPRASRVLTIAVTLPQQGGRIAGARVAYGAMGPAPLRAPAVERALEGQSLDAAGIARRWPRPPQGLDAADRCHRLGAGTASEVAPVHLRRVLLDR